jgi:hypothetical protein
MLLVRSGGDPRMLGAKLGGSAALSKPLGASEVDQGDRHQRGDDPPKVRANEADKE